MTDTRICESGSQKIVYNGGNDTKLKTGLPKSPSLEVKMLAEFIGRGIAVDMNRKEIDQ